MKYKYIVIMFFLLLLSCNSLNNNKKVNTVISTIYLNKNISEPLILIVDLSSNQMIIFNTILPTNIQMPEPPDSISYQIQHHLNNAEEVFETIKLSDSEALELQNLILNFSKEDFINRSNDAVNDGVSVKLDVIYKDNKNDRVLLINDFSKNHQKFYLELRNIIYTNSQYNTSLKNQYKIFFK